MKHINTIHIQYSKKTYLLCECVCVEERERERARGQRDVLHKGRYGIQLYNIDRAYRAFQFEFFNCMDLVGFCTDNLCKKNIKYNTII